MIVSPSPSLPTRAGGVGTGWACDRIYGMKNCLANVAVCLVVGLVSGALSGAEVENRERPAAWADLVPGARFVDRFEPSKPIAPLSSDCWGYDTAKPRDVRNGIEDAEYTYWGGNIRRDDKGKYHLFVARWPEKSEGGHFYWAQSTVCHAVSDAKEGPFVPVEDLGKGHNPEVFRCADGSWCIYVIWGTFRAPTLDGPWKREGQLPMVGTDGKWTGDDSNFSFCEREDGSVLAISRHGHLWISPDGLKPFVKQSEKSIYPAFDIDTFEDPVIWKDHVQYNVIVNDWKGRIAYHLVSADGVRWELRPGEAYVPGIAVVNTTSGPVTNDWFKFERMKVFQDRYGRAVQANFAVIDSQKWEDQGGDNHSSKNITIPLNPGRLAETLPRKGASDGWTVRIKAEPGFAAAKDVDAASLRFGTPEEVAYGRGVAPRSWRAEKEDLVVAFPPTAIDGPFAKVLGRERNGRLLFCDLRVEAGFHQANALLRSNQPAAAARVYRRLRRSDSGMGAEAGLRLAALEASLGHNEDAIAIFSSLLDEKALEKLTPEQRARALAGRGRALYRAYRFREAESDFGAVGKLRNDRKDEMDFLSALCLYGDGREREAAMAARTLLARLSESPLRVDLQMWLATYDAGRRDWRHRGLSGSQRAGHHVRPSVAVCAWQRCFQEQQDR